jgi:purine nucleosidase
MRTFRRMSSARAVVIDTDPGIDDAMAIAVALASPELDVVALTTTFGNHHVEVTTANAVRILDALGRPDIPVVAGAHRPLVRDGHGPATFVHGQDGLGDAGLPPASREVDPTLHAAVHIVELLRSRPGEITLVPIGPLTNLALALRLDPGIADLAAGVVAMGGAVRSPGNVTPVAEANIWNDPEAADIVLGADWPVTLLGLDVTRHLAADRAWLDSLASLDTPGARLVADTAPVYVDFHVSTEDFEGIHCHDVATIVQLIAPEHFHTEPLAVRVEARGLAAGQTIANTPGHIDPSWADRPAVEVALGVDGPAVLDLVRERLGRVPRTVDHRQ